jgi:hypothetical protein
MTLVLEGVGDGKIRVSASAWPEPKVILEGHALQVQAVPSKQFWVTRLTGSAEPPVFIAWRSASAVRA